MAKLKIHAGDFPKGTGSYVFGIFTFPWGAGDGLTGKSISAKELDTVDIATEESVKRIGGTVGWGVVGATLLGPVGMLAGLLMGGKKQEVTFVARFKDGKKMLATVNSKTYKKIQAAVF